MPRAIGLPLIPTLSPGAVVVLVQRGQVKGSSAEAGGHAIKDNTPAGTIFTRFVFTSESKWGLEYKSERYYVGD